jgi:hypothetical protein
MKRPHVTRFVLAAATALTSACSLNPQPFPPYGGSTTQSPNSPIDGSNDRDASLLGSDAGSDTSAADQVSPIVRGAEDGANIDAVSDATSEAETSADSASDGTIEDGE